ncbi:hypothetical protein SAMN04488558_11218 [Ignavigranum ruoffiae]|uniref:HTH cro/C1-type domain-containing protein n=1 Tax=Ignavigranum ruoffiae TaxID=89093 RepID=A0A1H9GAR1_9LACT|nr:helix-turn-helix transcriptional regulator [Ignavigranum ruoffiae]SEQ46848.1 hypothetical protein SAMN04488558_11218 [Ignavigranum ruoffiae]
MEINKKDLGKRIMGIRLDLGLYMQEFADEIKKHTPTLSPGKSNVSRWERGENIPNDLTLKAIADLGNLSLDQLKYGYHHDSIRDFVYEVIYSYIGDEGGVINNLKVEEYLNKYNNLFENSDIDYDYIKKDLKQAWKFINMQGVSIELTELIKKYVLVLEEFKREQVPIRNAWINGNTELAEKKYAESLKKVQKFYNSLSSDEKEYIDNYFKDNKDKK